MPEASSHSMSTTINTCSKSSTITANANGPISDSVCMSCGLMIKDRYIYKVSPDMIWHENCLKCTECDCMLKENATCFIKNGKAYCKNDYYKTFSLKCDRCSCAIKRNDFYMKSKQKIYHFDCFLCTICHRKLMPGDEYLLKDDLLYCKEDAPLVINHHQQQQQQQQQTQLYIGNLISNYLPSSMAITPENSTTSSSTFSPSTNSSSSSSSSSSSIADSPNSTTNTNITNMTHLHTSTTTTFGNLSSSSSRLSLSALSQTPNSSAIGNQMQTNFLFNSTNTNSYSNNNQSYSTSAHQNDSVAINTNSKVINKLPVKSYADIDFNDKEDDNSISDNDLDEDDDGLDDGLGDDDDDENEHDNNEDTNDNSISEGSSLNESANSIGINNGKSGKKQFNNKKNKNSKLSSNLKSKLKHFSSSSPQSLLQINGYQGQHNHHSSSHCGKPARIRTVLNEKQLQTLRACYGANPRPDALMKEQLVEMTGLNPRVIRVWFQNKRCKDKKKNMLVRPDHSLQLPQYSHALQVQQQTQQPHHQLMQPQFSNNNNNLNNHNSLMYENCF